jgi:valyl-tRNA synthetase
MHVTEKPAPIDPKMLSLADRWMLSRLNTVTHNVAEAIDGYHFNTAANEIYQFVWHEFCDWYLEAAKPALYGKWGEDCRQAALSVSWRVLHETLILLHPFIPFVTEEIWHLLPGTQDSIMRASYPSDAPEFDQIPRDPAAEADMNLVIEIITGIRNIRGEMNIAPSLNLSVLVQTDNADHQTLLRNNQELIANLARLESLDAAPAGEKPKATATAIVEDMVISVYLEGVIDFAKESQRLEKEIGKLDKELQALSRKLENENFISKAPAEVIEKARHQHSEYMEKREKLKNNLHMMQTIAQ